MVQHDIVVIGASAEGVQALKTVVSGLPSGFPAAVLEERLLLREMEQLARERNDPAVAKECAEQANQAEQRVQRIPEVVLDKDMLGHDPKFF